MFDSPIIEVLSGDLAGRSYTVASAPFTIGRDSGCALVIPKRCVSRRHAEIVAESGRWVLRGLSEKNPLLVSGEPVAALDLEPGAEFELSGIQFRFHDAPSDDARDDGAAQGSIVFGDEETEEPVRTARGDDERTDAVDLSAFRASGSGARDPFAQRPGPTPEAQAARERIVRLMTGLGAAGIVLAGVLVVWLGRDDGKPKIVDIDLRIPCAVDEVRRYDVPITEQDPPDSGGARTPLDGSTGPLLETEDPGVAGVEWADPDARQSATFLVRGVGPGTTTFSLSFKKTGVTRRYHVRVEGESRHQLARKRREVALAALDREELKRRFDAHLRSGAELEKALENPGPRQEGYPRAALRAYELAEETLHAFVKLVDRLGMADPEIEPMRASVGAALERARDLWKKTLDRHVRGHTDVVKRGQWEDAAKELQALIRTKGDACDQDVQRWRVLFEHHYAVNGYGSRDAASSACPDDEP